MEILHLTATQFLQPMGTGRTRPVLLGAEDSDGKLVEVVVKLRGPEMSAKAQIAELVAAPLADLLGIDVPEAAGFRFMENHVFYPALRGGRLDLGPFEAKLAALSDEAIDGLLEPVPAEWRDGHDLCERMADYLREAREEKITILNFVKHILR